MQKADPLIRTKLRLPFTRSELVLRPRLDQAALHGLLERGGGLNVTLISIACGCPTDQEEDIKMMRSPAC